MSQCKACDEPLVLQFDNEVDEGVGSSQDTIPDDLALGCGCHFHWQCLMDESQTVVLSLKCPSCETYLPSNEAGPSATNTFLQTPEGAIILAQYTNEGGVQRGLDILPSITEEAYVQTNPEVMPARAMHVMCSEGDVEGIVEVLRDSAEDGETDMGSLIRYQDPLSDMKSGLHLAVENSQQEVVWLLLWLSSTLPTADFPGPAREAAESVGLGRLEVNADEDVRSLQNSNDETAEQVAQRLQGPCREFLDAGILSP